MKQELELEQASDTWGRWDPRLEEIELRMLLKDIPLEDLRADVRELCTFCEENYRLTADVLRYLENLQQRLSSAETRLSRMDGESPETVLELQAKVKSRLRNALKDYPEGTLLAVSYTGKILAQGNSAEVARGLRTLRMPPNQVFLIRKGQDAAFDAK